MLSFHLIHKLYVHTYTFCAVSIDFFLFLCRLFYDFDSCASKEFGWDVEAFIEPSSYLKSFDEIDKLFIFMSSIDTVYSIPSMSCFTDPNECWWLYNQFEQIRPLYVEWWALCLKSLPSKCNVKRKWNEKREEIAAQQIAFDERYR